MRVTVLGAGVVGVTTAFYLARAGHEVTVLDRQAGPALETSFANAGEISPGYASPWAAPGVPVKALKWLTMAHAPLILRPKPDLAMAAWILTTLRNCTASRYAINKSRMVRLAQYSRDRLVALRAETGLTYDHRSLGTLQLFRTQAQMDGVAKDVSVLEADGVAYEVLDTAGCVAAEPGLAHAKDHIVGGLRLPGDETGDCFKFTQGLAALAAGLGVDFRYGVTIQGLEVEGARVTGVRTDQGVVTSEAYVVALGSHSPALLRPFGVGLPIYPVKGYSITVPIKDVDRAPVSTLLDESFKIAITRLGDRIRVGGMAELSGYSTDLPLARRRTLEHCLESLFPGAGATEEASFWSGLRPMTPDSVPLIGPCALGDLFLNTGHGTLGWTMACGSAQVVADQISGVRPAIETQDLSLARSPA